MTLTMPDMDPQRRKEARSILRSYPNLRLQMNMLYAKMQRYKHGGEGGARNLSRLQMQYDQKHHAAAMVEAAFQDMEQTPHLLELLRGYFLTGEASYVLARRMGYSERHFYRLLNEALDLFAYHYFL